MIKHQILQLILLGRNSLNFILASQGSVKLSSIDTILVLSLTLHCSVATSSCSWFAGGVWLSQCKMVLKAVKYFPAPIASIVLIIGTLGSSIKSVVFSVVMLVFTDNSLFVESH